jgi:cytochrome b involved in lipid metabolism
MKLYTKEELAIHNNINSLWISIDGYIFDITNFLYKHPGGIQLLLEYAGKDATDAFNSVNHVDGIRILDNFCIGKLYDY